MTRTLLPLRPQLPDQIVTRTNEQFLLHRRTCAVCHSNTAAVCRTGLEILKNFHEAIVAAGLQELRAHRTREVQHES